MSTAEELNALSGRVIGAAIEVHKVLGPGLLESAYEACLCRELESIGIGVERQSPLSVEYKGLLVECAYRLDLVVDKRLIVELKCVEVLLPIHMAQTMTYLRLTALQLGLLMNFNVPVLKTGIKRVVNNFPASANSASLR